MEAVLLDESEKHLLRCVLANRSDEVQVLVCSKSFSQETLDDALVLAAWRGRLPLVKLLLEHGADIQGQGYRLNTALGAATGERKTEVVRFLLSNGAEDPDNRGQELLNARDVDKDLHLGVKTSNSQRIESAVFAGARLDSKDQNRQTSIEVAARRGNLAMVELLLNLESEDNGFSNSSLVKALDKLQGNPNDKYNDEIAALIRSRLGNVSVLTVSKRFYLYGKKEPSESRLKRDEVIYGLIKTTRYEGNSVEYIE